MDIMLFFSQVGEAHVVFYYLQVSSTNYFEIL